MMRGRKAMQDSSTNASDSTLREQLLTHVYPSSAASQQHAQTASQTSQADPHLHPAAGLPHHSAHNIDPAIAGPPPPGAANVPPAAAHDASMMSHQTGDVDPDDAGRPGDSKKAGKRELSTSKRAAQNRAAQRAFRQRKEGHIKKLEEQVREYGALLENYKRMQNENYSLREYIISLQTRLLESGSEYPPVPLNIDLHGPRDHAARGPQNPGAPQAPMNPSAASALQGIAKGASVDVSMADRTDPALTGGA